MLTKLGRCQSCILKVPIFLYFTYYPVLIKHSFLKQTPALTMSTRKPTPHGSPEHARRHSFKPDFCTLCTLQSTETANHRRRCALRPAPHFYPSCPSASSRALSFQPAPSKHRQHKDALSFLLLNKLMFSEYYVSSKNSTYI